MIRSALLLIRTSLLSVLFLTAALFALGSVMFDDGTGGDDTVADVFPSLALIGKQPAQDHAAAAALHSALFDPARRPETVSGSIDDLKQNSAIDVNQTAVVLSGVLLDGSRREAMFTLGGGEPEWGVVGAEIGGWRVASIDAEGAVIERNGESLTLKIADRYKLHAKAQPPAASGQPGTGPGDGPPDPMGPPDATRSGPP